MEGDKDSSDVLALDLFRRATVPPSRDTLGNDSGELLLCSMVSLFVLLGAVEGYTVEFCFRILFDARAFDVVKRDNVDVFLGVLLGVVPITCEF